MTTLYLESFMMTSLARWKHLLTIAHTVLKDATLKYRPAKGHDVWAEAVHFFRDEQHWKVLSLTRRSLWYASNHFDIWPNLPPFLSLHLVAVKKLLGTLNKIKDKDVQDIPCTLVQKGSDAFFHMDNQELHVGTLSQPCPDLFLEHIPIIINETLDCVTLELDCEQLTNGVNKLLVKTRAQWEPVDRFNLHYQQDKVGLQYNSGRNYQSRVITIPGTWTNVPDDYTITFNPRLLTSVISRLKGKVNANFNVIKGTSFWRREQDEVFHQMAIGSMMPDANNKKVQT